MSLFSPSEVNLGQIQARRFKRRCDSLRGFYIHQFFLLLSRLRAPTTESELLCDKYSFYVTSEDSFFNYVGEGLVRHDKYLYLSLT